ncbi:GTP pyrophosphokinase [Deinococcus sp.]|uniref:GTP pyrophosphokinase n=1 Tax=Deinococcus sp. TaxID=47478 RepID=UPI003B593A8C
MADVSGPPETADLTREYRAQHTLYSSLHDDALRLIEGLIEGAGIKIHHLTSRLKTPGSLSEKLRRKPGRYAELSDVTDLVGVRIITYFEQDVSAVARALEAVFEVDWSNSIDKSKFHDPDRFGYLGVHYVVQFASPVFLGGLSPRFEVQIRSILQHAWAEIEHDLGYKSRAAVPREVQRRFYRLAGLLEMADEEFMAIHRLSKDYQATLPERVEASPDNVFIDAPSLTYLLELPEIQLLDLEVAQALNVPLLTDWPDAERPQRLSHILEYVEIRSVGQLLKELRRTEREVLAFAAALPPALPGIWTPIGGVRPGTSIVHYALWRACGSPGLGGEVLAKLLDLRGSPRRLEAVVRGVYQRLGGEQAL